MGGRKLFGIEYTYTQQDWYNFSLETPWWSPIVSSSTSTGSTELYSEGEQGILFTAYFHKSSDIVSSSVGFTLFSAINLDISPKKITLSVGLGDFSMALKLGAEETGFTISRKNDDLKETFGIVMKLFDGNNFNFSLVGSYTREETDGKTTKTTTTDFGISLWFILGLVWIISELLNGNVPDISQFPQSLPIPQAGTCVLE